MKLTLEYCSTSKMRELKKSDLQIGDILVFENQDFDLDHFIELALEDKKIAAFCFMFNALFYRNII